MLANIDEELNAISFTKSDDINTTREFNLLLNFVYICYKLMIKDDVKVPHNDENKIRNILLNNYLNNNTIRHKYTIDFLFNPEVPEQDGRTDIKVQTLNSFVDTDAYYIFECKRLNGESGLNKLYNNDGIARFTTNYKSNNYDKYYTSYYKLNAMIGFVISSFDIDANMKKIVPNCQTIEKNKSYKTLHAELTLLHLMMDFSKNTI